MENEIWDLYHRETGRFVKKMIRGEDFVPDDLYHEAVEVIATDKNGHMLVVHGKSGLFEFPGGSVFSGEEPRQTAKRKLLEEAGIKPKTASKISEGFAPGVKRYVYLAYVPDLQAQTTIVQQDGAGVCRITTVDGWLDMLVEGTFDPKRACGYNKRFFDHLREQVGEEPTWQQNTDESVPRVRIVSDEELAARCGTRKESAEDDETDKEVTYIDPITGILEFRDGFSKIKYTSKERERGFSIGEL